METEEISMRKILNYLIHGFIFLFLAANASAGSKPSALKIRFWTTEEQPARLAKQQAMAAEFKKKTGHTVEVIPVTEKDMGRTFKNQEEMRLYRANQEITPYSLRESKNMIHDQKEKELRNDTERAYTLAKQDELYKEVNAKIMSNLYKLTDK